MCDGDNCTFILLKMLLKPVNGFCIKVVSRLVK